MYANRIRSSSRYRTTEKVRNDTAQIRYIQETIEGKHKRIVNRKESTGKDFRRWYRQNVAKI
jgi:hypothetical protein